MSHGNVYVVLYRPRMCTELDKSLMSIDRSNFLCICVLPFKTCNEHK